MRAAGVALLLAACTTDRASVQHVGGMREVMHDGRSEARAVLADYATPGTFGVGALTGLQGEVTIDDGVVWVAVEHAEARPAPAAATATLLTSVRVAQWQTSALPEALDLAGLERELAATAAARGAPTEPLPFVLEGRGHVELHVVRGACPNGEPAVGQAPARWSADDVPLRFVGFFAAGREGVMTHMGTALHVHVFASDTDGRRVMGHVDAANLQPRAVLRLPAPRLAQ